MAIDEEFGRYDEGISIIREAMRGFDKGEGKTGYFADFGWVRIMC